MTDANLTWIDLTDPADRCAHGPRPQNFARDAADAHELSDRLEAASRGTVQP